MDHLANGIEAQWEDNPKLSFEDALDIEFKKFGVFGFMDVVSETEKSMGKQYRRFLLAEVKDWFKLPQLLFSVILVMVFFSIFKSSYSELILAGFYLVFASWMVFKMVVLRRTFKSRRQNAKKWMLEHIIFQQASGVLLVALLNVFHIFNLSHTSEITTLGAVLLSVLFAIAVLVSIVSLQILPNKADQLLKETYPTFVTN